MTTVQTNEYDMEEYKTLVLHPATDDSQPPHLIIEVEGSHYPIVRGQPTRLNSRVYEVMAGVKESYPFTVVQIH